MNTLMIIFLIINAYGMLGGFKCKTKHLGRMGKQSRLHKRFEDISLASRYFDDTDGTSVTDIFNALKNEVSRDYFSSSGNSIQIPITWIEMESRDNTNRRLNSIIRLNWLFYNNNLPISFKLQDIKLINLQTIDADDLDTQNQLFNQFKQDDRFSLPIFVVDAPSAFNGTEGWTVLPHDFNVVDYADAIFINDNQIDSTSQHLSGVLAHEIGHWLGLYHVFEGGCEEGNGDWCHDTPKMASMETSKVALNRYYADQPVESCPNDSKEDILENVMDYGIKKKLYTKEQQLRIMNFVYYRFTNKFIDS